MRLQQMIERLKASNCRITPQRYAVLNVLGSSSDHPSAENIHAKLIEHYPTMGLATVYKAIHLLKREGEILELEFSDLGNSG
ncbi:MAG: transcriptional repressor [Proteobacteria bacterium]|nr:transcriptional repressor [Pseudomonadota bacterium]